MKQLTLFPQDPTTSDMHSEAPAEPLALLRSGATLVLSISGGKDSDAMSHYLLDLRASEGWTGEVVMLHADLGRAEWHNTPEYVHNFAQRKGVELHVVRHSHMDSLTVSGNAITKIPTVHVGLLAKYATARLILRPLSPQNFSVTTSPQAMSFVPLASGSPKVQRGKNAMLSAYAKMPAPQPRGVSFTTGCPFTIGQKMMCGSAFVSMAMIFTRRICMAISGFHVPCAYLPVKTICSMAQRTILKSIVNTAVSKP
jgi:hypothetical protein